MITFKRILCPIDFSETSRRALSYAMAFAQWYEAQLEVLHVLQADGAAADAAAGDRLAGMHTFIEEAGGAGLRVHADTESGRPHDVIVRRAAPMDLLVMGTHGRSGFNRLLLGSVTEKVVRTVTCPVLTVPPTAPPMTRADVVFKKILCPIDFSPASMRALTFALELGRQANGEVTVLHAIEYLDPYTREYAEPGHGARPEPELGRHLGHLVDQTRERLRARLAGEPRTWCRIEEAVVTNRAYKAILQRAAESGVDLIVMGAQGHDALDLMLYGSTTQHVVRAAACPVLTVRA